MNEEMMGDESLAYMPNAQMVEDGMEREAAFTNILDLYQQFTPTTWVESEDWNGMLNHAAYGLFAEAGEIAGAYQKYWRGDYDETELQSRVKKEMGGLLYYLSQLANMEGIRLTNVLIQNRDILIDRQNRNVIKGDGDNR